MSDALTIYVYRQSNGWESDIWYDGDNLGGCTGPTLAGCMDTAYEIISEHDPEWANFDSNEDSRKRHMYQAKHSANAAIVKTPVKPIINKKIGILLSIMLNDSQDIVRWIKGFNSEFGMSPLEMIRAGKEQVVEDYLNLCVWGE